MYNHAYMNRVFRVVWNADLYPHATKVTLTEASKLVKL
jgi:hypothetical protein